MPPNMTIPDMQGGEMGDFGGYGGSEGFGAGGFFGNPLTVLLFTFGFDNIKKLGDLVFASDEVEELDFVATFELLDTIDLRSVLNPGSAGMVAELLDMVA